MLYASAAAARRTDKPTIDAQPLHIRWVQKDYSGPTTFTFFVFFLTTPLHELLDKLREKAGRLPDVLAFARHQIDMVEHRDTLLHQLPGSCRPPSRSDRRFLTAQSRPATDTT